MKIQKSIYTNDFEGYGQEPWSGGAFSAMLTRGKDLGASIYELRPNTTTGNFHYHHGSEEMLIMIKGTAILRTMDGERQLIEGEVVSFPVGPDGVHQVINNTNEIVRLVMVGIQVSPDVVEYPDHGMVSIMAKTDSQLGEPLWDIRKLPTKEE